MEACIINVKNLGKKYRLGFIRRDNTIRDKITHGMRNLMQINRGHQDERIQKSQDKEIWALRNISFDVQPGEVVGIIGRNGAGKSTLLKILSKITEPTEGEIWMRGRASSLLEVGTGFHPELSGRENIFMNGAILGMTRAEIKAKFDEIVAFAEVEKFIDTPVKRYSSGMYVRLAFAVAAHLEPEILMVDEVLAVGDVEFQKKCLGKMQDVSSGGRTVLFVSHNMAAIRNLAARCVLLHRGKIHYIGDTDRCINKYLNLNNNNGSLSKKTFSDVTPTEKQPICIKEIRMIAPGRGETHEFYLGEPWSIEIDLESNKDRIRFQSSLQIFNQYGVGIYHLVLTDSGIESLEGKRVCTLRASLDKVNLYPGRYFVTVWLGHPGHQTLTIDCVESAISFEVSQNSGKGALRSLNKPMAIIHETANWEVI